MVGLTAVNGEPERRGSHLAAVLQVGERGVPIDLRLPFPEQVEVGPVDHQDGALIHGRSMPVTSPPVTGLIVGGERVPPEATTHFAHERFIEEIRDYVAGHTS